MSIQLLGESQFTVAFNENALIRCFRQTSSDVNYIVAIIGQTILVQPWNKESNHLQEQLKLDQITHQITFCELPKNLQSVLIQQKLCDISNKDLISLIKEAQSNTESLSEEEFKRKLDQYEAYADTIITAEISLLSKQSDVLLSKCGEELEYIEAGLKQIGDERRMNEE